MLNLCLYFWVLYVFGIKFLFSSFCLLPRILTWNKRVRVYPFWNEADDSSFLRIDRDRAVGIWEIVGLHVFSSFLHGGNSGWAEQVSTRSCVRLKGRCNQISDQVDSIYIGVFVSCVEACCSGHSVGMLLIESTPKLSGYIHDRGISYVGCIAPSQTASSKHQARLQPTCIYKLLQFTKQHRLVWHLPEFSGRTSR